jgi:hypothetical protein
MGLLWVLHLQANVKIIPELGCAHLPHTHTHTHTLSNSSLMNLHTVIAVYVYITCLFVQLRTAALRLIVRSWLDVPTFSTRHLHVCHHVRAPSGRRWNCGREMSGNFTEMMTSTPFRDLLHAVKLQHGTDGFTSPPKEVVLRIFSP